MDILPDKDIQEEHDGFIFRHAAPEILSRMALNDNKAGMQGLNKDKINRIIHENSVGSRFYENERKKDAEVDVRIQKLLKQVEKITPQRMNIALSQANNILKDLDRSRDLSRTIVHVDMDAFYASVEERDNPELKNKPMAVGGMDMLCTSNYAARRYGVRAAMPGFIGKKLCPDLILVPLKFSKYLEVSTQVRELLADYDSNFTPVGLDEAYLDLTLYLEKRKDMPEANRTFTCSCIWEPEDCDWCSRQGSIIFGKSAEDVVREIRFKIKQKTKLTASAGIAPNTLLAKVASDINKPDGQFFLQPAKDKVIEFVKSLPIRKVSGIGKVTEKLLNAIGVETCQDLYDQRAVLYTVFSQTMSHYCLGVSIGIGSCHLGTAPERKSISTERTFRDVSSPEEMYKKCEELCDALEHDAKKADVKGLTITLKLKTATFEVYTRSKTVLHPVSCKTEVYPFVVDLLKVELAARNGKLTLRLIGVGLSKLVKGRCENQQMSMDFYVHRTSLDKSATTSTASLFETESLEVGRDLENAVADSKKNMKKDNGVFQVRSTAKNFDGGTSTKPCSSHGDNYNCHCHIYSSSFTDSPSLISHIDPSMLPLSPEPQHVKDSIGLGIKLSDGDLTFDSGISNERVVCFTCPVCNAAFCCKDVTLEKFNAHIDSCLSRKTVMDLVKSEAELYRSEKSPKTKSMKNTTRPPKKRRKCSAKPDCILDHFFK